MGLLTKLAGNHIFDLLLSEFISHEPDIQKALIKLSSDVLSNVSVKLNEKLEELKGA